MKHHSDGHKHALEEGAEFAPGFNADGLIPAIATDHASGDILMVAWMNAEALDTTLRTGIAHFWSRSRAKLWRKGEESGNTLRIQEIRTDCDQDVLWLKVAIEGDGKACHTGRQTCFYRVVTQTPADAANEKNGLSGARLQTILPVDLLIIKLRHAAPGTELAARHNRRAYCASPALILMVG